MSNAFAVGDEVRILRDSSGDVFTVEYGPFKTSMRSDGYVIKGSDGTSRVLAGVRLEAAPAEDPRILVAAKALREANPSAARLVTWEATPERLRAEYIRQAEAVVSALDASAPLKPGDRIRVTRDALHYGDIPAGVVTVLHVGSDGDIKVTDAPTVDAWEYRGFASTYDYDYVSAWTRA